MKAKRDLINFIKKLTNDPRASWEMGDRILEYVAIFIYNKREKYRIVNNLKEEKKGLVSYVVDYLIAKEKLK